jgi:putative spermidine/putrescine transport system permease protein
MMQLAPSRSFRITAFAAWLAALFLTLPFVVVFPVSLTPQRYLSLPDGHWSLRHYATLIEDPTWLSSIRDSLIVATGSTLIALLLGTTTALACWRLSSRLSEMVRMVMLAPMIVPSIVHALGFYKVWAELGLLDSYLGVIIAHAMKATPYVVISVSAALANVDFRLEQAARNLGATTLQALWKVILPAAKPGMLAGAVFAFALSWDELVVNLFITSRRVYTLPRKIWDGIQDNINPAIAAVASLLILFTVAAMMLRILLARRRVRLAVRPAEP